MQGNRRLGNALLEEQGGKASITKNGGIPKQSLDGVLKASCTLPCWEAGGTRSTDHEHKVRPKELMKLPSFVEFYFSIAPQPQGRGDNISFRRFYVLVPQCDKSRGIPRETNLSIVQLYSPRRKLGASWELKRTAPILRQQMSA